MLPVDFATDEIATDRLSAMAFTGGFTLAAVSPYVVGIALDFSNYTLIFLASRLQPHCSGLYRCIFGRPERRWVHRAERMLD